jgi:hypothetical protein
MKQHPADAEGHNPDLCNCEVHLQARIEAAEIAAFEAWIKADNAAWEEMKRKEQATEVLPLHPDNAWIERMRKAGEL